MRVSSKWEAQNRNDLRAIWDDIAHSVNSPVSPIVFSLADDDNFTPTLPADIQVQANTQGIGTLTANAPVGTPYDGEVLELIFTCTAVQTFAWNAIYVGCTTTSLPTVTSGAGKTDKLWFQYNAAANKWQLFNKQLGYA
jgi:hypothetical protein